MIIWFVSRHPGALQWMREHGPAFDRHVPHLDITQVHAGDTVIGTLPVNLAAQVCAVGGIYQHLSLQMRADSRGKELSAGQLNAMGATLQRFDVRKHDKKEKHDHSHQPDWQKQARPPDRVLQDDLPVRRPYHPH